MQKTNGISILILRNMIHNKANSEKENKKIEVIRVTT